jgi:type VI secretion system protein ImpB
MSTSFQNEIPAARINLRLAVGKGDAQKKVELPLKMLVLGDFSGKRKNSSVAERERIAIDRNNFAQVMQSMDIRCEMAVDDTTSAQNGSYALSLPIKGMDSFKPESIAREIPSLRRLLAARNLLKDLRSNLIDNRDFRRRLEEIVKDPLAVKELQSRLSLLLPPATTPTAA